MKWAIGIGSQPIIDSLQSPLPKYSKNLCCISDIRQQQEAANNASDENVYTVTPVSVTLIPTTVTEMHYNDDDDGVTDVTDTNDDQRDIIQTTTLDPMTEMYSGHYHEENPGQYHEVNPGQYHEVNPGQYHEVNPGIII